VVASSRSLGLIFSQLPKLVLECFDLAFTRSSVGVRSCSIVLLRTLGVMSCLHALQLQPPPVDDLVGKYGDQYSLEHRPTPVFVEVALLCIRIV
jgi:hypothetical protein